MNTLENDTIRSVVRENYGQVATTQSGCCAGASCCSGESSLDAQDISQAMGYSKEDVMSVPDGVNMGLGCGNPQAIAALQKGEIVIDLGSGAGFDVFLAAQAVGNKGYVIGVDMTPEMISRSRSNAEKANIKNVEFRLGEIEHIPVADNTADVIISNCVINLSPEKAKVFQDAFRVLKPGGRLAISDVVKIAEFPDDLKQDMTLYSGCATGASSIIEVESLLQQAGFNNICIKPKDESKAFIAQWIPERKVENYIVSATIEALKPARLKGCRI